MRTLILIFVLLVTTCLYSTIINVPADQPTIQAGIDTATDADTVLVQPGTYVENINYNGKLITIASLFLTTQDTTYISQTVIDGNQNGSVVTFNGDVDSTAVLTGFTITNGNAEGGGGIYCNYFSSPSLTNVRIIDNYAECGGGILFLGSSSSLVDVTILGNSAALDGGGLFCWNSNPILQNVTISGNIAGEDGGGIWCGFGALLYRDYFPSLANVTITDNYAVCGGGIFCGPNSNLSLVNCILWNDSPEEIFFGSGDDPHSITISYSDIEGGEEGIVTNNNGTVYWLEGNMDEDPLFANPAIGDYHLTENSPCIDEGDPFSSPDPDGSRADMGAYYFHHIGGEEEVFADFYADTTNVYMMFPVDFYDLSIAFFTEITTWLWDFDNDGSTDSYEQNPSYIYQNVGYYSVSLTVEDDIGNSNTMIKTDYIAVHSPVYSGHCFHISQEGSDEIGNGTPEYPFATIQHGISVVANDDTVLVHQGTYPENINYNGKNIIIGSLFLTTQDTTYISQTIIDGSQNGSVVTFSSGEDSTAVLNGFTITNGNASSGGGIFCYNSDPSLENVTISDNSAYRGSGVYCANSSPNLENVTISGNSADNKGGGIYCGNNSNPSLQNVTISGNSAYYDGGGIYCSNSSPSFSVDNRCNIYSNTIGTARGLGTDIFAEECDTIHIFVDTFTVMTPTDYYASPIDNFTFDILHSVVDDLINADVYVSVDGDDSNSGTSPDLPFKTINYALEKIFTDSMNIHTIHLAPGIYSNSTNGETFPIHWSNYVNLFGNNEDDTILDAESTSGVMDFNVVTDAIINNITITNGSYNHGGGIRCKDSSPSLENVVISDNTGSGICLDNSSPSLMDVTISGNSALSGGGIRCINNSSPSLENVIISGNSANYIGGGGIYCNNSSPNLINVTITANSAVQNALGCSGGGIYCGYNSSPSLENVIITYNHANKKGGGINFAGGNPILQHVTITGNSASDSGGGISCSNSSPSLMDVTISCNSAEGTGYGNSGWGGGIYSWDNSSPDLENVTITDNSAKVGGGIFFGGGNPILQNVTITSNSAVSGGGGIYCGGSSLSLFNVTISGNNTGFIGGGIRYGSSSSNLVNVTISDNIAGYDGGGISCFNSSPILQNVTITGNSATYNGSGIYCRNNSSLSLVNCILWNDSPQEIYFYEEEDPDSITISYSDIEGGEAGIVTNNNGTVNWLEGNIDEDPLFVGTGDHPFMLQDLSPCINTGIQDTTGLNLPEFDLAGNPRVYGGRIDMGAYENQNVVGANEDLIPLVTRLNQNYPNPFNPTTTISFSTTESTENTELVIYNIKGQKVKQLVSDQLSAGQHSVVWNGKDDNGKSVSSGIYFYKLKTDSVKKTKKMVLVK